LQKNAPVLAAADWQHLLERALAHVHDFALRIRQGEIAIRPYQLTPTDFACQTCVFQAVCHIDRRWDTRPFRFLTKMKKPEVLTKWQQVEEGVDRD